MKKAEEIANKHIAEITGSDEIDTLPIFREHLIRTVNDALEWAAQQSELEPRVWDSNAPDPQTRIAEKICKGKSQ